MDDDKFVNGFIDFIKNEREDDIAKHPLLPELVLKLKNVLEVELKDVLCPTEKLSWLDFGGDTSYQYEDIFLSGIIEKLLYLDKKYSDIPDLCDVGLYVVDYWFLDFQEKIIAAPEDHFNNIRRFQKIYTRLYENLLALNQENNKYNNQSTTTNHEDKQDNMKKSTLIYIVLFLITIFGLSKVGFIKNFINDKLKDGVEDEKDNDTTNE